ncbi:MAG: YccF domain-containing protein [Acidimicrobiales bacterium]
MRTLGNILWLVLAGFWLALGYVLSGIIMCVLIITIPFGLQAFKLANYTLWPFGRTVVERPGASPALGCLGNVLWLIFAGIGMAIAHLLAGVALCLTIIGIPLGLACFKLIPLALLPFGKEIVPISQVPRGVTVYYPPPSLGGEQPGH